MLAATPPPRIPSSRAPAHPALPLLSPQHPPPSRPWLYLWAGKIPLCSDSLPALASPPHTCPLPNHPTPWLPRMARSVLLHSRNKVSAHKDMHRRISFITAVQYSLSLDLVRFVPVALVVRCYSSFKGALPLPSLPSLPSLLGSIQAGNNTSACHLDQGRRHSDTAIPTSPPW